MFIILLIPFILCLIIQMHHISININLLQGIIIITQNVLVVLGVVDNGVFELLLGHRAQRLQHQPLWWGEGVLELVKIGEGLELIILLIYTTTWGVMIGVEEWSIVFMVLLQ